MAYGVAIHPDRFDDLLTAWDAWFDVTVLETEGAFDKLASSFDDAVSAAESLQNQAPYRSAMDQSPSPGILLDQAGAVLDVNSSAAALLQTEGCDAEALLATAQKSDFSVGQEKLGAYRLGGGQQSRTYLAVEAPVSEAIRRQHPAAATDYREVELSGPAGVLKVVEYAEGRPVLCFTTSSRPEEVASVRSAFAAADLRVIAPARPGFRGSARTSDCASEGLLDDWLDALMQRAGPAPIFAGHREGGILAAKAAARAIQAGKAIGGLVLISTGVPAVAVDQFKDTPPTIRRSFLGAHYARAAVVLGYKTAARIFRASKAGEDKIVQYFYRDSPVDAARLSDPIFYETTRDNIAYCFNDPAQIVKDIADWTSDWSSTLDVVTAASKVTFVHGRSHTFQKADDIEAYCAPHLSTSCLIIEGSAQLVMYEQPLAIGRAIQGAPGGQDQGVLS